jgi:hypothetical protein
MSARRNITRTGMTASASPGELALPDGPGLGVEIDPKALARLKMPVGEPVPDGAYSDMSFGAAYDFVMPPYRTQD